VAGGKPGAERKAAGGRKVPRRKERTCEARVVVEAGQRWSDRRVEDCSRSVGKAEAQRICRGKSELVSKANPKASVGAVRVEKFDYDSNSGKEPLPSNANWCTMSITFDCHFEVTECS